MRELPRKLTVEELAELFEGRTRLVEILAETEDPLGRAEEFLARLDDEDRVEALAAHPAIGQRSGLSERSAAEQGSAPLTSRWPPIGTTLKRSGEPLASEPPRH